jgi:hypothetical protein
MHPPEDTLLKNPKFEYRNPKWFDRFDRLTAGKLTTLLVLPVLSRVEGSGVEGSNVEGQIQNPNFQMTKTKSRSLP